MTDISKPPETVGRPIRDLPPEAGQWGQRHYRSLVEQWRAVRQRLILDSRDRMHHANGGITVNGDYHPPFPEDPTDRDRV